MAESAIHIKKEKEREKESAYAPDGVSNVQPNIKSDSSKPTKKEIDSFFEEVWKLYPKKRGKANVKDAQRRELYRIGKEELQRAITRYQSDLEKQPWRQAKDGSTFFNGGYADYLDSNYEPIPDINSQASAKQPKPAGLRFDP